MEKIDVYYAVHDGGDGSAYPSWYLSLDTAELASENNGLGEPCCGCVETFEGSNVHTEAIANEKYLAKRIAERKELYDRNYEKWVGTKSCEECPFSQHRTIGTRLYHECILTDLLIYRADTIDDQCIFKEK